MFFLSAAELETRLLPVDVVVKVPIRKIPVVIDMKDPLSPELALDDFRKLLAEIRNRIVLEF